MPNPNPLAEDLDHILAQTSGLWDELRGQKIFITGATGFFGCWLLESFAWANEKLNLRAEAVALTRNLERFRKKAPHLANHPAIRFQIGDVRHFDFPEERFAFVIHAATEASVKLNQENPALMFDTIVAGTRRTLDFAAHCGAKKFLLTSSGAVYGPQPPEMTHLPEDYLDAEMGSTGHWPVPSGDPPLGTRSAPELFGTSISGVDVSPIPSGQWPDGTGESPVLPIPLSAYAEGKRAAEQLCVERARQHGFEAKIARCFAFVGPYLPLDTHFAIGNFIRDALSGGPIHVQGNGTPYRSYLYAADLAIWLWTILLRGKNGRPYNVGSTRALPIYEIAQTVDNVFENKLTVCIAQKPTPNKSPERYVPSTSLAAGELNLRETISLEEAIRKTIRWNKGKI